MISEFNSISKLNSRFEIERNNYNQESNCDKKKWWPKLKKTFDMKIEIVIKEIEIRTKIETKTKIVKEIEINLNPKPKNWNWNN